MELKAPKYVGLLYWAAIIMSSYMSNPSVRKKSFARSTKPSVRMCIHEKRDGITMSSSEICWPVPMRAIGAQNLLTMPGGVATAGYLHKKGGSQFSLLKWPLRYTIIHKGCVYYFKSSTSATPQGAFSLNGYNRVMRAAEETTSNNVFPFKIVHFSKKHRTWFFSAASEDERRKWMRYLRREIDYYNDRRENQISSDSDTDADSFYGTIELPMDIKHPIDNTDDDYGEDDDDDDGDEEDYLKPDSDSSPTSTGRPTGPPPSYPPPPVPTANQHHQDSRPGLHKSTPPPIPPLHRMPTCVTSRKSEPSIASSIPPWKDPNKGLPFRSPLPPHPHLHPPPPPPHTKKPLQVRMTSLLGTDKTDQRNLPAVPIKSPSTLPICNQLEASMVLNGPARAPYNVKGSQSMDNFHSHSKPSPIAFLPANMLPMPVLRPVKSPGHNSPSHLPLPPLLTPEVKAGLLNKTGIPKPPAPSAKPQPLPKARQQHSPLQRASPEGQSFRSLGDEKPSDLRRKQDLTKHGGGGDSDDDYENVQLPDSVFIDTTETSIVEKLFKENPIPPQDGLYGIRNSGSKNTKVLVVWDVSIAKARNYRLFEEENLIFLDSSVTFPALPALIEHYYSHPLPHHGSLCLQKPYMNILGT